MSSPSKWLFAFALAAAAFILSGCIADTAEDSDLPWATNQNWEGLAPLPTSMTDRYD